MKTQSLHIGEDTQALRVRGLVDFVMVFLVEGSDLAQVHRPHALHTVSIGAVRSHPSRGAVWSFDEAVEGDADGHLRGISASTLHRIEMCRQNVTLDMLETITDRLKVTFSEIFADRKKEITRGRSRRVPTMKTVVVLGALQKARPLRIHGHGAIAGTRLHGHHGESDPRGSPR